MEKVSLEKVEVFGDGALLRAYSAEQLLDEDYAAPAILVLPEDIAPTDAGRCWQPVLYFGFTLASDEAVPETLSHKLHFKENLPLFSRRFIIADSPLQMNAEPLMVLQPPFAAGRIAAIEAVSPHTHHRKGIRMFEGNAYISQRFAIDWVRLNEEGILSDGPATQLDSYPGYGLDMLAVAPGKVIEII